MNDRFASDAAFDAPPARLRRVGQVLVAVPALFFTLVALYGIDRDLGDMRRERARSAARTAQAVGTVVEVHERYSMRTRTSYPVGTVAFTTSDGAEVRFSLALEGAQGVGLATPVYYDPADPKNNAVRNDTWGWADVIWPNLLPGFFAAVLIATFIRIGRMKRAPAS